MRWKKTLIICVVVAGLFVATPAHGFVAAYIQRAIMIFQQVTQIGKATEQIKQFKAKLDKIREQVDMVKDLKDSTLGELGALKDEFTSLVSKPTEMVGDTMGWGSEFKGESPVRPSTPFEALAGMPVRFVRAGKASCRQSTR